MKRGLDRKRVGCFRRRPGHYTRRALSGDTNAALSAGSFPRKTHAVKGAFGPVFSGFRTASDHNSVTIMLPVIDRFPVFLSAIKCHARAAIRNVSSGKHWKLLLFVLN